MSNVEYITTTRERLADVTDFINYVFSNAHRPHDFKRLQPRVYGDNAKDFAYHFSAVQDGRFRANVALLHQRMHVLDAELNMGFVGNVSVHPYARGEGHMKRLMAMMLGHAQQHGLDLLVLGGQRQRYNYFGFEAAGTMLCYEITATNVRHCLGDADVSGIAFSDLTEERPDEVDFAFALAMTRKVRCERSRESFMDIMHMWDSNTRLIRLDGEPVGYVMGAAREIMLTDESLLPRVIKALLPADGLKGVEIRVAPHETQRIQLLRRLCERCTVEPMEMIRVLNWQRVLEAYMKLKGSYVKLDDGCATVSIDGEPLTLTVENGAVSVAPGSGPAQLEMTGVEAVGWAFGIESALCPDPHFGNWFPLPFPYSSADSF